MADQTTTLEALQDAGAFEVTLRGESLAAFLSKKRCVYFEWTYGVREGGEWARRWSGYHSEAPITVRSPKGTLELSPRQLRTFLSPAFERTWTEKDKAGAPEVVVERLGEEPELTAAEYCLEAGRSYHARVHVDEYSLPPRRPGEPPGRGRNAVLWISDQPFDEAGRPRAKLTPAYEGWSY